MNILIVSQYYYPEQFSINQISVNLTKMGNKVTVLTGVPNYPMGKLMNGYKNWAMTESIDGVEVIRVPMFLRGHGLKMILNYLSYAMNAAIKASRIKDSFDVIFVYEVSPVTQIFPAWINKKCRNKSARIVVNCQDIWPEVLKTYGFTEKSLIYKAGNLISRKLYRKADTIAVTSPLFEKYLIEQFDIDKDKIKLLMNYADEWVLNVEPAKETGKKHFLFAGNMGKTQNLELILKAVAKSKRKNDLIVDFVGDGSEYAALMQLADALNINGSVKFHGRKNKEDLKLWYDTADAYLLTLKCDNKVCYTIPAKVQGYMGAGKPIIASILGGAKELIEKTISGIVCAYDDADGLAEILDDFVANENKYKPLGYNGRAYFKDNFRERDYMAKLLNILEG